ncbi:MAG: PIG-L family deacetylase [Endomicrobiales bacterium]|nr:PIG-L family deacetylase [Endomicrobiales bacterium]
MVKFIRYQKLFRLYELIQPYLKYSLVLEEKLPCRNVLVLAPHQDDESVGCGGTLIKHVKSGGNAAVAFCTADNESRDEESRNAMKSLGINDSVSWKYGINSLAEQKDLPEKMINLFDEKKPEIVFIPFLLDNHYDHRAVNNALIKAGNSKKYDFLIYAYPVWFPLYPNVLSDISGVWEGKAKAISCYKSQIATRDYVKMSLALGQYWAQVKGRNLEVVETFFKATFKEYVSLGKKVLAET